MNNEWFFSGEFGDIVINPTKVQVKIKIDDDGKQEVLTQFKDIDIDNDDEVKKLFDVIAIFYKLNSDKDFAGGTFKGNINLENPCKIDILKLFQVWPSYVDLGCLGDDPQINVTWKFGGFKLEMN